ncbi:MAG: ABC transporter ATP-binding protein [Clostridia bacterium]|nr:ABC transporter ATP-binding protein [Clostridia bacterium]
MVLEAKGIKKSFTNGEVVTEVLKGIDFCVDDGEFVAIVGESGSGKSTFLYILAGVEKQTEGSVVLLGKDLSTLPDKELAAMRRREFSFVYQFDNLVPNLTVYENIVLPLVLDKQKESDFKAHAEEVAEYLGISSALGKLPSEISGGEQQRVAIARALVTNPKVIFLDEPTGSLDKERGRQVMELLKKINEEKGVALVMITHSQAHAEYASRIVRMDDGVFDSLL